jgi:hypothetical protein
VTLPASLNGFGAWYYTNDVTNQRITVTTSTSNQAALITNIVSQLGGQASQSGSSPTITLTWVISN